MARKAATRKAVTLKDKIEQLLKLKAEANERYKQAAKLFDEVRGELPVDEPLPLGNGTSFVIRDQFVDQQSGLPIATLWKKQAVNRYDFEVITG